jgi:hypothetical protein
MAKLVVEFHFPSNWSAEGSVDVLYSDPLSGGETSYGTLTQGATKRQETYEGHLWLLREAVSRELLLSIVARKPEGGGDMPMLVTVGYTAEVLNTNPLRAAVWRMGQAPREPLLKASSLLLRILSNIVASPSEPKYRSVKASNASLAVALDLPGVLALLSYVGFEQVVDGGEPRLALGSDRPIGPVHDAAAQMRRLDALLRGLPPPGESLASMQHAMAALAAASSSAADAPSHTCGACGRGIENDLRRKLAGSGEIGGWRTHNVYNGEYRFHCKACGVDLCSECYDKWKEGAPTHSQQCQLSIEAPITTPWGGSSYGVPPAPPPVNSARGRRRGPWG